MSKLTANALDGILAEMRKMANAKLHDKWHRNSLKTW
jgi:hypothetical protein